MAKNRYSNIFTPGGMPTFTYNPREQYELEKRLTEAFLDDNKLIAITGLTKTGKSVLAKRIFPKTSCLWFEGGMYSSEDDFWEFFLEKLNLFNEKTSELSSTTGAALDGTAEIEGLLGLVRAKFGLSVKLSASNGSKSGHSRKVRAKILVLDELSTNPRPIIIDDFHYIPKDDQGKLIRAFKGLIFEGLPVVIIAIPHRRFDAEKVEREMEGRINRVPIPVWDTDELMQIGMNGFPLLKVNVDTEGIRHFANESFGSPHLMQEYCKEFCKFNKIVEELDETTDFSLTSPDAIFGKVAEDYGRPVFEKLKRGPRVRTDRVKKRLRDGREVDNYELLLAALIRLRPAISSITYETIKASMRDILNGKLPQVNEVSRVFQYMMKISTSESSSSPVIDWDKDEKVLHVIDPYFAFFLKWTRQE